MSQLVDSKSSSSPPHVTDSADAKTSSPPEAVAAPPPEPTAAPNEHLATVSAGTQHSVAAAPRALNGAFGADRATTAWTARPTPFGSALHAAAAAAALAPACYRGDENASTVVLAKPRLTLKPSGLAAAATAAASTMQPAAPASALADEPAGPPAPLVASSSSADSGGDSSGSKFLRSARLLCKPLSSAAEPTRADTDGAQSELHQASDGGSATAGGGEGEVKLHEPATADGGGAEESKASGGGAGQQPATCGGMIGGFVFGQNLGERVTNADQQQQQSGAAATAAAAAAAAAAPSDSGDFVFGSNLDDRVENAVPPAAAAAAASPTAADGLVAAAAAAAVSTKAKQSLEDAASEYERQRSGGPLLPEVEVVTGEEEESNVLQANCRLFCFDKERSSYAERGRGLLRLNDSRRGGPEGFRSRIVMRTSGILRVILNTKIWSGMLCEKINQKSLRITGMEDGIVRVFLVTATPKDVDGLLSAVLYRVDRLRHQEEQQQRIAPAAKTASSCEGGTDASSTSRKRQTDGATSREDDYDDTAAPRSPSKKARADEVGQSSPEADVAAAAST